MEHVVFFPAHDGSPAFRRTSSLEEAVRLVEHLRNVENVSEVGVHALTEVPLNFKPYYKVELPSGESAPAAEAPAAVAAAPIALAPDPTAAPAVAPEPVALQAVVVPEQAEAPVEGPVSDVPADETAAARESGAASLGFFAS